MSLQLRFPTFTMNARHLTALFCMGLIGVTASAADEAPKKQATKEEIQARLAEHARKKAFEAASASSSSSATPAQKGNTPIAAIAAPVAPAGSTKAPAADAKPATEAAQGAATPEAAKVLPKVEVKKGRITELDRQLDKQNEEIAREKKNTKPTPLDETLNGPKVSSALAIFGGQSSTDRSTIAKERVSMMEEERDMIEAIAQATTKEEKEELQKTLDSMRDMRRELEKSLH
jgi:hypothetical protein